MKNSFNEPTFQWTPEKAKAFLESRNKASLGKRYDESSEIDFDHFSAKYKVNRLIHALMFDAQAHQVASVGGIKVAAVFEKHGLRQEQSAFEEISDVLDNTSESALEMASRAISAAKFLGIPLDDDLDPNFKPSSLDQ